MLIKLYYSIFASMARCSIIYKIKIVTLLLVQAKITINNRHNPLTVTLCINKALFLLEKARAFSISIK